MNTVVNKMMHGGNVVMSKLYQRSNGKIGGKVRGLPVLILTVRGRKTGNPRSTPVAYFENTNGYLIVASAGGAKDDPQWFRNLLAASTASVQIGAQQKDVAVHIAEGAQREQLWHDVVLAKAPFFGDYAKKSGRVIPIVVLTPTA